jgi:hypothetical protein
VTPATLTPRRLFDPVEAAGGDELEAGAPEAPVSCHPGGRPTLEDALSRVWEGLHADGVTECPVCRGRLESGPGIGRCRDCGSTLS